MERDPAERWFYDMEIEERRALFEDWLEEEERKYKAMVEECMLNES